MSKHDSAFPPILDFALELRVDVGPPLEVGSLSCGMRRTIPILGGVFTGPRIAGCILPGGADWQFTDPDGLTELEAHYIIETDDGVRIEVRNKGIRCGSPEVLARIASGESVPPEHYYFRTTPRFYPPKGKYDWLNQSIFVGTCERYSDLVVVGVWKLL
jgi:hypothetical protein